MTDQNEMPELKPCPFCGDDPHRTFPINEKRTGSVCRTPLCAVFNILFEVEQWNTRADLAPVVDDAEVRYAVKRLKNSMRQYNDADVETLIRAAIAKAKGVE